MRWPVVFLLLSVSCFVNSDERHKATPFDVVERRMVTFSPPVFVAPDSPPCMGLIKSPERVVAPEACVSAVRKVMMTGAVTVNDINGERVGSLPDLSGNPLLQIQSAVLPPTQLPFIPDQQELMAGDVYPRFIPEQDFVEGDYFVFSGDASEWLPVEVSRVDGSNEAFSLTAIDVRLGQAEVERLPVGNPIVNEWGGVLCTVSYDGVCRKILRTASLGNDGTCHLDIFDCDDPTFDLCFNGNGAGSCIRPTDGHNCTLTVFPDGSSDHQVSCHHHGGCGAINCQCHPVRANCSCSALWGFCFLDAEAVTTPHGCIAGGNPPKPRDQRCNPTASPTSSGGKDSTSLGLIIGLPVGAVVLTVSAITVIAGVLYRVYFRRITYENLPN